MGKLGSPKGNEGPKSSIRNRILAGVMAVIGGLGGADCALSVAHVSSPGGRVTVRNGRMEACSEDPNYVEQFRNGCKEDTVRVFKRGEEICLQCDSQ